MKGKLVLVKRGRDGGKLVSVKRDRDGGKLVSVKRDVTSVRVEAPSRTVAFDQNQFALLANCREKNDHEDF